MKTPPDKICKKEIQELRGQILKWYDAHGRDLPWRYKNGETPNPYYVWLSEIMCQQTTVQAVKPYYTKFIARWPTVQDLADAESEDVMQEWAGLGYYARARNLHKCAKVVANDLNGKFPNTQAELIKLPGIGDYTSAAIAAIVFNEPVAVMDGNIERIVSRLFALHDPLPKSKPIFKDYTAKLFEGFDKRPGDLAQALMDIGSSICTPKNPKCMLCPIHSHCKARKEGIQESLPVKIKAKNRPQKFGEVYWITNNNEEILTHKRPDKGLLGGMIALPTSSWETQETPLQRPEPLKGIETKPFKNETVQHVFTHFDLELTLKTAQVNSNLKLTDDYSWKSPKEISNALPTVFKKAFNLFV